MNWSLKRSKWVLAAEWCVTILAWALGAAALLSTPLGYSLWWFAAFLVVLVWPALELALMIHALNQRKRRVVSVILFVLTLPPAYLALMYAAECVDHLVNDVL